MIIDCIADTHGHYPQLEGGDLLIVAGDLTKKDSREENFDFFIWLTKQKYKKIIVIGGNHDNVLQNDEIIARMHPADAWIAYLCDSGTEFEYEVSHLDISGEEDMINFETRKLKIWGSPWTKRFKGMNPKCMAFTVDTEEELAEKWKLIPLDTDILVTHCPPYGMRDGVKNYMTGKIECVGSKSLQMELVTRLKPKLVVCGHIHEDYGQESPGGFVERLVNASHVNERYEPVNKPIRLIL